MTIFHFSALLAVAAQGGMPAKPVDLTPRSPLEAIVLGDAEAARAHLTTLAKRGKGERKAVVAELFAAGFTPDRGSPDCDFYGYYRRTTAAGAARSVQVALCATGNPVVLVLDMLPPGGNHPGFRESRKRNEQ